MDSHVGMMPHLSLSRCDSHDCFRLDEPANMLLANDHVPSHFNLSELSTAATLA